MNVTAIKKEMDQEIRHIEDYLKSLPVKGGLQTPPSYLDDLDKRLMEVCREEESLLVSFSGSESFRVPDGYFENLEARVLSKVPAGQAKILNIQRNKFVYWSVGLAAAMLLVAGLFFTRVEQPATASMNQPLSPEEIADHLGNSDINADLLCDAGWCNELDVLNGKTDPHTDEILDQTDTELLMEEL